MATTDIEKHGFQAEVKQLLDSRNSFVLQGWLPFTGVVHIARGFWGVRYGEQHFTHLEHTLHNVSLSWALHMLNGGE